MSIAVIIFVLNPTQRSGGRGAERVGQDCSKCGNKIGICSHAQMKT